MAITIDAAAALNQYQRTYEKDIKSKLKEENKLELALSPVSTERTHAAPNAETDSVVQPYQEQFTPNLVVNLSAEENTLQKCKVDIQFPGDTLDQFFDTWLIKADQLGISRLDYTFPKYLYNEKILPQIIQDLHQISWHGQFAAPTPGTPGAVITSADGLAIKIKNGITAGDIVPIAVATPSPSTMVATVEAFCDSLPLPYRGLGGEVWMSTTLAEQYWRDYRGQFGTGNGVAGNENSGLRIDNTNKVIRGFSEMEGSNRYLFVPKTSDNLIIGHKKGRPTLPVIRWQEFDRILKGLGEFHRFYGYKWSELVFVSDNE